MESNNHKELVRWREWGDEAFQDAQAQDKPILLDIGAVWCHWCHVMDHGIPGDTFHTGTYSNSEIAKVINEEYIPIKVDNDKRPDINARYNMGGWPTTAFLTPTGDPLYGETYVHPQRMAQLLGQIAEYYHNNKADIAQRIAEHRSQTELIKPEVLEIDKIAQSQLTQIDQQILMSYDHAYAGFGTQPKFPHPEALEYALLRSIQTNDRQLSDIFINTMEAMADGGMFDQFAGGFFRYSTTRDWSIPHFEKMLEDNAKLSRLAFLGARHLKSDKLAQIGDDVHNWLFDVMFDSKNSVFYGSQDADKEEEYYGRPHTERDNLPTPYIDKTIYLNWNALMVSSLCERYRFDQDLQSLAHAMRCYEFLMAKIFPYHSFFETSYKDVSFLLADMTSLGNAALDLSETCGGIKYLNDAVMIDEIILDKLDDTQLCGYFDTPMNPQALGALSQPAKDLASTSAAASFLIKLYHLNENPKLMESVNRALGYCSVNSNQSGLFASSFGLTILDYYKNDKVIIVGDLKSENLIEVQKVCWNIKDGGKYSVLTLAAGENAEYTANPDGTTRAYVCKGTTCNMYEDSIQLMKILLP